MQEHETPGSEGRPLRPGMRLGPYEIEAPLGSGGMGDVYRARDTRLSRLVAIKVLSTKVTETTEARARLEREARAVSSLNHPHICVLHDVGRQDGIDFLVMEYLEGETLADRLERGPLELREALSLGAQIADALDRAHQQGLVHRDLKPGNIMLTLAGAKLMDFGLAKAASETAPASPLTAAPTATSPLTQQGMLLGTLQYMAPEQLEGREADSRSDIFAFGAVLHEMITGERAFPGTNQASVIAAILKEEPRSLMERQPLAPRGLERLVRICLAKQPRDRWQSAADLRRELEWLSADDEAESGPIPRASRATPIRRRVHVAWTTVALTGWLVALGLVFFGPETATKGPPQPTLRAEVPSPAPRSAVDRAFHGPVALSPDGGTIALAARGGDTSAIWIQDLATGESRQLTGTEGARAPFWSPDGSALGFFASEKLKRIPREGGVPQTLADAPSGRGAAWSPEGMILFAPNVFGPLWVVSEQGGEARPATEAEEGLSHRFPHFLADGRTFVFLRSRVVADHEMALASLDDPVPHGLRTNQTAAYPVGDYLLFEDAGQLVAQRLDLGRKALVGGATPLVENVWADSGMGMADFSASENEVVVWGTEYVQEQRLEWVDASGRATVGLGRTGRFNVHRLSPDGRRLLLGITEPDTGDVELRILDLGTEELLLASPRLGWAGAWSPDSRRYATVDDETRIVVVDITSGSTTVLATTDGPTEVVDWSPDGDSLLLMQQNLETGAPDIMTMGAHDGAEPQAVLQSTAWDWPSRFSPDGRFVTFLSDRLAPGTGRYQLYATRFPEGGEVRQISADGVTWDPQPDCPWSPDGKFIYWIDPRGKLMRVPWATEGGFRAGPPQEVMAIDGASFLDIARDGRILTMVPTEDQPPPSLHLLVNWTKRLPQPGTG